MKNSWLTAAALAVLFASPALAQDRGRDQQPRERGQGHYERGGAPAAQTPPAQPQKQAPQQQARPQQGRDFGRDNGPRQNSPGNARRPDQNRDFRQFNRVYNAPRRFRAPAYRPPRGFFARRWSFGERLPPSFWVRDYWLLDYFDFGLPPPPPGTLWVRVGSDALLIDRFDGEIIEVVYGVFF